MLIENFGLIMMAAEPGNTGMSTILQFLLLLVIIIFVAKAAGYISSRLGQPAVLGELLGGVILGPSLLNIFGVSFITDSKALYATIKELAELGVILLMFSAGLETNIRDMFKVGKIASISGTTGVIVPILLGGGLALFFGYGLDQAFFIGIILAATSVSISAQTLLELGVLRKKVGIALLGAAVLDDILVVLILSLFVSLVLGGGGGLLEVFQILGQMVAFFAITGFLGLKVLPWALDKVKKLPISEGLTAFTLVIVLLTSWAAEYLGQVAMIVGAFLCGVLIAQTRYRDELAEKFHVIVYAFFVPIFFVSIGLILNLGAIAGEAWLFAIALASVAILSKILGCGLGARVSGFSTRQSLQLGLGMVSRGEVGLIVANVGINRQIINDEVYAGVILMVLVTTLFTPFALKLAFRNEPKAEPTHSVLQNH